MEWKENLICRQAWSQDINHREEKERIAWKVAARVNEGEVVGIGSGSTVYLALRALAERVKAENLRIRVITASLEISMACIQYGLPLSTLWKEKPDWTFDGADEADEKGNLIKGRGGALFKEKLLIACSREVYILVDQSKLVDRLGSRFPIPVEVFPMALPYVEERLRSLGAYQIRLRSATEKDGPLLTENRNLILDVRFETILPDMEKNIKAIPGVIESGLFMGYPLTVWAGNK